jgi:hypothetical protein
MSYAMTFKPPEKFVPINGSAGPFEIALAMTTSNGLQGYHYRDKTHDLYFYAEVTPLPFWDVKVSHVVTGPARTIVYKMNAEEGQSISANIEFFFKTRKNTRPTQELEPGAKVVVSFEWRVVR